MVAKGQSRSVAVATLLTAAVLCGVAFAAPRANGAVSTPWPGGRWQPDAAQYGMTVVKNVPVKMDDGVTLFATSVTRPTARPASAPRGSSRCS